MGQGSRYQNKLSYVFLTSGFYWCHNDVESDKFYHGKCAEFYRVNLIREDKIETFYIEYNKTNFMVPIH